MHQIETGQLSPNQQDCAFLWLWCRDGVPYAKYLPDGAPATMPMVFAMLRWDGMFGAIGGKVDAGEDLREALAREVWEEATFALPTQAHLVPLGTFMDHGWHVHSFALEVTFAELVAARANASAGLNSSPECAGFCIAPTGSYIPCLTGPRGIKAFSENRFCSTAKLEFEQLLKLIAAQPTTAVA